MISSLSQLQNKVILPRATEVIFIIGKLRSITKKLQLQKKWNWREIKAENEEVIHRKNGGCAGINYNIHRYFDKQRHLNYVSLW
jgi:hypothetical protein